MSFRRSTRLHASAPPRAAAARRALLPAPAIVAAAAPRPPTADALRASRTSSGPTAATVWSAPPPRCRSTTTGRDGQQISLVSGPPAGHRPGAPHRLAVRQQRRSRQLGDRVHARRRPGTSSPPTSRPASTSSGSIPAASARARRCAASPTPTSRGEFFGALPPFPVSPDEIDQATRAAKELGRRCRQRNGELLDHVVTANVARDMDLLRQAVGDDQLTFAGYSYGGLIGMTYAQLFPGKVRATADRRHTRPRGLGDRDAVDQRQPFSVRVDSAQRDERRDGVLPRLVPGRAGRSAAHSPRTTPGPSSTRS